MKRKTLGVIGGVGPLSTAYFMERVIQMTDVKTDQEHIDMVVLNHTEIPDRTAYILNHNMPNPAEMMCRDAQKLESLGCDVIVTPCNTAHYFYKELSSAVEVPFLNMIEETAAALCKSHCFRVGILATNGTLEANLFQNALAQWDIEALLPTSENQQFVMDIIYDNVKAGAPLNRNKFDCIVEEFQNLNCDRLILGCTELSILKKEYALPDYYLDALEVLAARAIESCDRPVKL